MIAVTLTTVLLAAAPGTPRSFTVLSEQSRLVYRVVHKLHQIEGVSKGVEGRARVLPDGTAQVQVQTKVAEFDSGNDNRDAHMKEAVEAAKYPTVVFKGVTDGVQLPAEKGQKLNVTLKGQLTFHGVTRPIEVPITLERVDEQRLTADATFSISLTEFKVERPELLLVKVDDKMDIVMKLSLLEKP
jgi:polyisoprenoid-binding protein YceI